MKFIFTIVFVACEAVAVLIFAATVFGFFAR